MMITKLSHSLLAITASLAFSSTTAMAADRQNDPSTFSWNPELSKEGPVLVAVSLDSQKAAVYRNGIKIGECLVSTGFKGHETPTGVFHILEKDADHHSSTYNNASMPFSQRLTWGGVALHAGSLPGYPSSHGCVHLPYEFSKKLFSITHVGTTVVITEGAPDVHVSENHKMGFKGGEASEIIWNPEASREGPVSLLYSSADKRLVVLRGGVTIAECDAKTHLFKKRAAGTSAFVFAGWSSKDKDAKHSDPLWVQVGGVKSHHAEPMDEWFEVDPRFEYLLHGVLTKGTNLVITDQPITKQSRSKPGFSVLIGGKGEKATKQDQGAKPKK